MNTKRELTVSFIMPALNEEKNIEHAIEATVNALKEFGVKGEVVVVNDGSTDATPAIVQRIMASNPSIRMITHERPMGMGYAFWDGMKNATMDIVTTIPGDNENDPKESLYFVDLLNRVDMVVPFIYNFDIRSRWRRVLSTLFRAITNFSFGTSFNYTNGAALYRRSIFNDFELKSRGFFFQTELLIKLVRRGYLFAEVPQFLCERKGGTSKAVTLRSFFKVARDYIRLFIDVHIRRTSGAVGRNINADTVTYARLHGQECK